MKKCALQTLVIVLISLLVGDSTFVTGIELSNTRLPAEIRGISKEFSVNALALQPELSQNVFPNTNDLKGLHLRAEEGLKFTAGDLAEFYGWLIRRIKSAREELPHIGHRERLSHEELLDDVQYWVSELESGESVLYPKEKTPLIYHGTTFNALRSLNQTGYLFLSAAHLNALGIKLFGGEGDLRNPGQGDQQFFAADKRFIRALDYSLAGFNSPILPADQLKAELAQLELAESEIEQIKKEIHAIKENQNAGPLNAEEGKRRIAQLNRRLSSFNLYFTNRSNLINRIKKILDAYKNAPHTILQHNLAAFPIVLAFEPNTRYTFRRINNSFESNLEQWLDFADLSELKENFVPEEYLDQVRAWKSQLMENISAQSHLKPDSSQRMHTLLSAMSNLAISSLKERATHEPSPSNLDREITSHLEKIRPFTSHDDKSHSELGIAA